MKKIKSFIKLFLFSLWIISCGHKENNKQIVVSENKNILIDLGDSFKFNWDSDKKIVVSDFLLDEIKKDYNKKRNVLINKINNESSTNHMICGSNQKLKKGDLAFLLIDKIENIKYYEVFGIQMDTFITGCYYPEYLIKFINNERDFIQKKLRDTSPPVSPR